MKNKYINLIKDTGIFALGSIGSKFILFFMLPLYTNYLSTEEYGVTELLFSLVQLIMPCVTLMISDAVIRFGMMKTEKLQDVALIAFIIWCISSIATICLTPLFGLYKTIAEWKWYLCLFIIANGLQSIGLNYLKARRKNKTYAVVSIGQTLTMAGLNIIFLVYFKSGIEGYLRANIITYVVVAIWSMSLGGFFKDLKKGKYNDRLCKKMIEYSTPLIFNTTSWWLISFSDKFMIEIMVGTSVLGLYTVATKIPSLINVIISIFSQAWKLSAIEENESSNDSRFYSNIFNLYNIVIFCAGIIIIAIVYPLMVVYVGKEFQSAWQYVPLLIVGAVFSAVSTFFGSMYSALKKTVGSMITALIAAVINIVVNLVFIPIIGVWGAIVGTVIAYAILANIRMLDIKKKIEIAVCWKQYVGNIFIITIQGILVSLNWHMYIVSIAAMLFFVINNWTYLKRVIMDVKKK